MAELRFEEGELLQAARDAAELEDFGGDDFRAGLRVLLETYRKTANFDEKGVRRNHRRIVSLLATRLRVQEAFCRHPEIRNRTLRRPMYLTGLPRTGTSALFNLLGADPAARPLLLWEGIFPDPVDLPVGQPDPRFVALKAHYARGRERNPEFTKIHYTDADVPEECVMLLAHTFCDVQMGIEPMMEPYASWYRQQDLRQAYTYYANLLKLIDWQRPGKRWLLKSPAHLWALDVLVEMFPDACIVLTHRNPLESMASACSLTDSLMRGRKSYDKLELGPTVLEYYAASLERGLSVREQSDPRRFLDIDFEQLVSDPLVAAKSVYDHFELDLTAETEAAMQSHVTANPQGKHGAHEYDLAQYGLTPDDVESRLADYIGRFALC